MTHLDAERLVAFLAGELSPTETDAVDSHLLECRECWRAVHEDGVGRIMAEGLREAAPAQTRDRVRLAISLAHPQRARRRLRWRRTTAALALVATIAVGVGSWSLIHTTRPNGDPLAVIVRQVRGAVAHDAVPTTVTIGPRRLRVEEYDLDGGRIVIAFDTQPFPMPTNAQEMDAGVNAPWSARVDRLRVLCFTEPRPALLIGDSSVTVDSLSSLAHRLALN